MLSLEPSGPGDIRRKLERQLVCSEGFCKDVAAGEADVTLTCLPPLILFVGGHFPLLHQLIPFLTSSLSQSSRLPSLKRHSNTTLRWEEVMAPKPHKNEREMQKMPLRRKVALLS